MDTATPICHIHHLPDELLSYIFAFHASHQHLPASIGTVCKLWYRILRRTPAAWSHIAIAFGLNWSPSIDRLPTWICRAGGIPLKLKLYLGTTAEWAEPDTAKKVTDNCRKIVQLVGPRAVTRVNIAYFTCTSPSHVLTALQHLFGLSGMHIDKLESFDLRAWRGSWQPLAWAAPDLRDLEKVFADAASISVLTCPLRLFLAAHPCYPVLDYLHVTEIDHHDSLHKALIALRDCPNISTLKYESQMTAREEDPIDTIPNDFEPIDLPHLHHLEIVGAVDIATLFRFVNCPTLKILSLRTLQLTHSSIESGFQKLADLNLGITKLVLRDFLSPTYLARFFRSLNSLVEVEFREIREVPREDVDRLPSSVQVRVENCTGTFVRSSFGGSHFSFLGGEGGFARKRRERENEKRRHAKWNGWSGWGFSGIEWD